MKAKHEILSVHTHVMCRYCGYCSDWDISLCFPFSAVINTIYSTLSSPPYTVSSVDEEVSFRVKERKK